MLQTIELIKRSAFCERGIAIVELALFLPIIFLVFIGTIASFDGIRASRQVLATADTVSDLISRRDEMDDSARDVLFDITDALLAGFTSGDAVSVALSSIFNDDDELKVLWSEAKGQASPLADDDIAELTLPTIPEGESLIIVQIDMQYAPLLVNQAFDRIAFGDTVFVRPRFVPLIAYNDVVISED